ncbi:transcriptional regulator, TetR family [Filimonas lacunae]|uniref:Transcriptional regulator, TetR family n=1 Tax=Filimonas lacunae TaxID=477680 RepID=A0A173MR85_9BACT|nr:TetR/AcrR family transcriptional regulator [Filimonas lacunae]BAV10016.1 transcriptional regulator, TetR family [Filimonas lacunae]SIS82596.1 transcriptional regulator, TetR family [Filimonas lacunae]
MEIKERISEKAEELFLRFGVRSITMDEIASQLGMSKKTIYQSFTDKDELVYSVFDQLFSKCSTDCLTDKERADNAIHELFLAMDMMQEFLKTMNPFVLYDLEKYHPQTFKRYLDFKNNYMYQYVRDNVVRGIKEEVYRADVDIEIVSRFRIGTAMLSLDANTFPHNKFNVLEVEIQLLLLYAYGLASPKGVKLIQKYNQQRESKKG